MVSDNKLDLVGILESQNTFESIAKKQKKVMEIHNNS